MTGCAEAKHNICKRLLMKEDDAMKPFDSANETVADIGSYTLSVQYQGYWKKREQFLRETGNSPLLWAMIAVEDGRFHYSIDGVSGEAGPGDVVFCPPNVEYARHATAAISFYYALFMPLHNEFGKPDTISELLRDMFSYKFTSSEKDRLSNNFRHLIRLDRQPNDPQSEKLKLHFINDIWMMMLLEISSRASRGQAESDPLMKKAKELIERNALRDVQIQDVAALLNLHPVQLTRRFQHIFGVSPSRYLISIRMEKAKTMLTETDDTIEQIAGRCGYENGFYFSRMFTKYTKMNPSQFRRIHRALSP